METAQWIILSFIILAGVWSLTPSITLRVLWADARSHQSPEKIRSWGRYRTLKRLVGIHTITNNIRAMEEFTKQDLEDFNRLIGKLDLPPATALEFERFSALPHPRYADVENAAPGAQITKVSSVVQFGVMWRDEVLRKAIVRGCSADYATLSLASENSEDLSRFAHALGERFTEEIELKPGDVEDYFNDFGRHDKGDDFLAILAESDPDDDFQFINVHAGDRYTQQTMKVNGLTIPGQHRFVTEVTHRGLARKSDPRWIVRAFVKILNQDRSEQV